jgi:hypothetical protein
MGMCLSRRGKLARINAQEREQMKAVSRFGYVLLGGALALAPAAALAQDATQVSNTPAPDSIGPQELQDFSLKGTVTRPADQPAAQEAVPRKQQGNAQSSPPAASPSSPVAPPPTRVASRASAETARRSEVASAAQPTAEKAPPPPQSSAQSLPSSSVTMALPKLDSSVGSANAAPAQEPARTAAFAPAPETSGPLAPGHSFPLIPWLLAALLLGAGGAFFFFRGRGRTALAGGPQIDAFTAPTAPPPPRRAPEGSAAPSPTPRPAPAPAPPAKAPPAAPVGIVSTRLRPWIEIGFKPLRCVLEDERVTVEFDLELFNSGSAPARAVLAEATLFNAGPSQDQEIAAFFAAPVGEGERIPVIPPLKRIAVRTRVVAPRTQIQAYELAGREVFVPVIAFNALYEWSGGEGQTSVSYLLGRDTSGEKMAPFRLDLGPRIFRGVAGRLLPTGVRR